MIISNYLSKFSYFKDMKISQLIKLLKQKILKIIFSSRILLWQYIIYRSYIYKRNIRKYDNRYRKWKKQNNNEGKRVVFLCEKNNASGGLVDRLRAIVSIYKTCKEQSLEFKILFNEPFELSKYLQPNKVDWEINAHDLNYNLNTTNIVNLGTPTRAKWMADKQEKWIRKELKKNFQEFHIISNTSYSYYYDYSKLFSELFKPSQHLLKLTQIQKKIIGEEFISVSCRFRDLLNDFNETCPIKANLTHLEQEELVNKNIEQIERLHKQYPNSKILVNSDSITFLNAAKKKEYTYVIPGNIGHIDNKKENSGAIHDKTFTDFYMIANAKHVYLLRTGLMFESGFPYAASLIYNKPFTLIEF